MFKQVMVAIDGERNDRDAVAAAQAVAPAARLRLVTVYPDSPDAVDPADEYRTRLRGDALRDLHASVEELGIDPADVDLVALPDYAPARGIKRYAREEELDLIVLGRTERGRLSRAVLGDVARGVLHGAECPVLCVARSRAAARVEPRRIGVAYDRSPEAEEALRVAVQVAQAQAGATLELVEAVDVSAVPDIWGGDLTEHLGKVLEPANDRLGEIAEGLPVPATASAITGSVHDVIRDLSTRVDLLVTGSRGWGAAGRIAFGSTADRLVHHSPVPVLVVPRSADAHDDLHDAADSEHTER